jgi:TIR domain-containing protein
MSGIFISYRREDSQELAGRLFDRLAQRFGKERVFRDVDAIDPGAKFAGVIGERIGSCDALVALIGRGWVEARDAEGRRRLDLPCDLVKAEIAAALAQGKLVIPVLIEGTSMPARGALPAELAPLADRNALPICDSRFDFDVGRLASAIEKALPPDGSAIASTDLWELIQDWVRKRFGLVGLVVLACVGIWWQWDRIGVLPGVQPLVARLAEKALPKAVPGKFNIALAHLEGDDKHEMERLIRESLAEFPNVATLSFDRLIASKLGSTDKDERDGMSTREGCSMPPTPMC